MGHRQLKYPTAELELRFVARGGCRLVVLVTHPHVRGLRLCVIQALSQVEMFDVAAVLKTIRFVFSVS
jgi:hypothetical protein